jgi:hypothetical protein
MGTPSGVNLTEFRGPFLALRDADRLPLSAGRSGAAGVADASGSEGAGTTGIAGAGGVTLTAVGEEETGRSAWSTFELRNAHAPNARKITKAAVTVTATAWLRRRDGNAPVGAGSGIATGVVRVGATCQMAG